MFFGSHGAVVTVPDVPVLISLHLFESGDGPLKSKHLFFSSKDACLHTSILALL